MDICFVAVRIGKMDRDVVALESQPPVLRRPATEDATLDRKAAITDPLPPGGGNTKAARHGQSEPSIQAQRFGKILGGGAWFAAVRSGCPHGTVA
jgi:hypothetical protein